MNLIADDITHPHHILRYNPPIITLFNQQQLHTTHWLGSQLTPTPTSIASASELTWDILSSLTACDRTCHPPAFARAGSAESGGLAFDREDSRVRGNDKDGRGNDKDGRGNDKDGRGNDRLHGNDTLHRNHNAFEILLIMRPDANDWPAPAFVGALHERRIGLECLTLEAGIRTFNLLLSDQRHILGLFILQEPTI